MGKSEIKNEFMREPERTHRTLCMIFHRYIMSWRRVPAILAAFFILGESLGVVQIFGAVLVVVAVGLIQAHPMIREKMMRKSSEKVRSGLHSGKKE